MIFCPDAKKEVSEETCRENRRVHREFNGRFNRPCASCGVVLPPRPKAAVEPRPQHPPPSPGPAAGRPRAGRDSGPAGFGDRQRGTVPRRAPNPQSGRAAAPAGRPAPAPALKGAPSSPGGNAGGAGGDPSRRLPSPGAGVPGRKNRRGKPPKCKCRVCFIDPCPNRREPRRWSRDRKFCASCGRKHYGSGGRCRACARKAKEGKAGGEAP